MLRNLFPRHRDTSFCVLVGFEDVFSCVTDPACTGETVTVEVGAKVGRGGFGRFCVHRVASRDLVMCAAAQQSSADLTN